ncbi:hypothetical protein MHB40_14620 [Lysinibacillus sp. FSL K6-0057]|uniref:hypothetical protein n=1 Tax=Lysinibacillus sp. FSL K6-0057 TaxID=2921411 RepID=UPI00315AF063
MKLYVVRAGTINDHYNDIVEWLDVEEKNSIYIGSNKRFKKSDIGKVLEGMTFGSYKMYLLNEGDINKARIELNKVVIAYRKKMLDKFKLELETSESFNTNNEYRYREY